MPLELRKLICLCLFKQKQINMETCCIELSKRSTCNMNRKQAKARLNYLLVDFVLPREPEKRQRVYAEIALLLEKVQ